MHSTKGSSLAPLGRYPYVTSIQRPGSHEHVCSGTLIDPWWVLTAAHCVDPDSEYSAGPRGVIHIGGKGVNDRRSNVEVMMSDGAIIHENWAKDKDQRSPFNLALLKLPHRSKHPAPELLQDHFQLNTGQVLMAAGWGSSGNGPALGEDIFGSLRLEPQQFISARQCNGTKLWNGRIQEGTLCGINEHSSASCVVDSGSPLLVLDTPKYDMVTGAPALDFLVGVNIDGAPCGTDGKPDVYVDIRRHAKWIQEKCQSNHDEL